MLESQGVVSPNQSSLPFLSWGAEVAISYNLTPDEPGKPTVSSQRLFSPSCYVVMTSSCFSNYLYWSILAPHSSGLVFQCSTNKISSNVFFLSINSTAQVTSVSHLFLPSDCHILANAKSNALLHRYCHAGQGCVHVSTCKGTCEDIHGHTWVLLIGTQKHTWVHVQGYLSIHVRSTYGTYGMVHVIHGCVACVGEKVSLLMKRTSTVLRAIFSFLAQVDHIPVR